MKVTLELLAAFIQRGGTISQNPKVNPNHNGGMIRYRLPNGISGVAYHAHDFEDFPTPVAEWIWDNIPMVPAKD